MPERVPFSTVPLRKKDCKAVRALERRDARTSGAWICELKTLTPLCLHKEFERQRPKGKRAFLPGTSLRGMIRNAAEVLGAGCGRFYGASDLPRSLAPCTEEAACLVCRIFGFVRADFSWQSRVRITDSEVSPVTWVGYDLNRRRIHFEQYEEDERLRKREGWGVFAHFLSQHGPPPGMANCVDRGACFPFRVEYLNLDDEEYSVLRFAVTLTHEERKVNLAHKLGFAKAVGLGSCQVRIKLPPDPRPYSPELDWYLDQAAFKDFERLRKI